MARINPTSATRPLSALRPSGDKPARPDTDTAVPVPPHRALVEAEIPHDHALVPLPTDDDMDDVAYAALAASAGYQRGALVNMLV
jgi:hypothetical protein